CIKKLLVMLDLKHSPFKFTENQETKVLGSHRWKLFNWILENWLSYTIYFIDLSSISNQLIGAKGMKVRGHFYTQSVEK
ncbi:hypothetical protein A6R68_23388, partial [Neotoma lepida]